MVDGTFDNLTVTGIINTNKNTWGGPAIQGNGSYIDGWSNIRLQSGFGNWGIFNKNNIPLLKINNDDTPNNAVYTKNNTLDDGSGNMTIANNLTVNAWTYHMNDVVCYGFYGSDTDPVKQAGGGAVLIGSAFTSASTPPEINLTDAQLDIPSYSSAPTPRRMRDIYFNTSNSTYYVNTNYPGNTWIAFQGPTSSRPLSAVIGQFYTDTTTSQIYVNINTATPVPNTANWYLLGSSMGSSFSGFDTLFLLKGSPRSGDGTYPPNSPPANSTANLYLGNLYATGNIKAAGSLYLTGNTSGYLWNNGGYIRQSGGSGFIVDGSLSIGAPRNDYSASAGTYKGPLYLYTVNAGYGGIVSIGNSSIRYKEKIQPIQDAAWLYNLHPITFEFKDKAQRGSGRFVGLAAEEVNEQCPMLAWTDEEGKPEGVHYEWLAVPIIVELQKLRMEVDQLKAKLAA